MTVVDHTLADFYQVSERLAADPSSLTSADVEILALFDGPRRVQEALQRHVAAVSPLAPAQIQTKAHGTATMNLTPDQFAELVVGTIKQALEGPLVKGRSEALEKRIADLEQRLAAVEHRPQLKYAGVYQPGERYSEARLVTHAGGLWLSTEETQSVPGTAASGWLLIVKSGKA